MVKFSVVVPVHNGVIYLRDTLQSILNQSYPHFTIIVLENCSTDGTVEVLQSFDDPRLRVVPSPKFLSLEENWARSLQQDLDEFMTILGHDDILYPNFLEVMETLIAAVPEASLYQGHYHYIDSRGKITSACQPMTYRETADDYLRSVHRFREDFNGTGYVFRSADFKQIGGVPPIPRLLLSDALCWYYLSACSYRIASPQYLCAFRVHGDSATRSSQFPDFHTASKQYLELLAKTHHFDDPQNRELAYAFIDRFLNGMYKGALYGLICNPDPAKIQQFFETKKQLLALPGSDRLFAIKGVVTCVYECALKIPAKEVRDFVCRVLRRASDLKKVLMQSLR
jgi:glycosyltransferase involved in cell wall biosynthesis